MKHNLRKVLISSLALIIALSPMLFQQNVVAQELPSVFVNPEENFFYTDTTAVGTEFDITIEAADWPDPGVMSFEFKLRYDPTMLEPVLERTGIDSEFWITEFIVRRGFDMDVDPPQPFEDAEGPYLLFASSFLGAKGAEGDGILAKAGFKIIAEPLTGKTLSCGLDLTGVLMLNPSAQAYAEDYYEVQSGIYQYISPPPPSPLLKASSHYWDDATAEANDFLFNITVEVQGLEEDWRVIGIQFFLEYDPTLINTKVEWVYEGDFLRYFGGSEPPTYFKVIVEPPNVLAVDLQLPPWPGPNGWANGDGVLATIQFEAIYRPPPAADCDLTLFEVIFDDVDNKPLEEVDLEHGKYGITVAPPPWLSISPSDVVVENVDDSFNINVAVHDLDAGFRMVGTEFKISYDNAWLSITEGDITEGVDNIMREVADRIGEGLFFQAYVEEDHGLIGIIILPLPNGTWPFFPEGTGLLATLKFTAIDQADDVDVETELELFDYLLVDADAKEIPIDEAKTEPYKKCTVTIKSAAPVIPQHPDYPYAIDLYTQYDLPYGGQGYDRPSDAFAPQATVQLLAKVTYFNDGVPGKPVSYTIDGAGGIDYSAVAITDDDGEAVLEYIMPFSEDAFGLWAVQASWQIGSKIVTDYLVFRVGWLVCVKDVELSPEIDPKTGEPATHVDARDGKTYPVHLKGESYDLSMDLEIMTMQHPGACMAKILGKSGTSGVWTKVTIFDELGQPAAFNQLDLTNQLQAIAYDADFVVLGKSRIETYGPMSMTIRPAAFSGRASVQANVLTDARAVAYCVPTITHIWISRSIGPPMILPTLTVSSHSWTSAEAEAADGVFEITITISDVLPDYHFVGLQFKLYYDCDLEVTKDNVTEGYFVPQFGDTFFNAWVEDCGVLVGEIQLPPYPGDNGWMRGAGTVAVIQFRDPAPWDLVSYDLTLDSAETFLVDSDGERQDFGELVDGLYEVVP